MKPTDFAYYLANFLSKFLPGTMGLSTNTIMSYRDTFCLLLEFCGSMEKKKAEKITLEDLDRKLVEKYLEWIEKERHCMISTRNVRLAAIHAFCRYLQMEFPDYIYQAQQILAIPVKKAKKPTVEYISLDAMKYLLERPDINTKTGRRDLVLLSLLYDSGARVQELADLKVLDVRVTDPATVKLTGKGKKSRIVPLMRPMATLLGQYLEENVFTEPYAGDYPLFQNRSKGKLTREGITYTVKKYVAEAINKAPELFPNKLSPHCFRHYSVFRTITR